MSSMILRDRFPTAYLLRRAEQRDEPTLILINFTSLLRTATEEMILSTCAANRWVTRVPYKIPSRMDKQAPLLNRGGIGGLKEETSLN